LGWAEFQAGEHQAALDRWRKLLGESRADAPWRPQVTEAIQAAAKELKLDPATVLAQIPAPPAGAASSAAPQPSADDVAGAAAMTPDDRMAMIRGMVEKLQARMDADGSDVQGWLRLAQSRSVLGETDRARSTFQKALSLHPDEPTLLKGYAETLVGPVRSDTGLPEVGDQAKELLTKAAGLQPEDPEVWWYLGIRALQDGRKDQARSAWQKVLARLDPAQPEYQDIKNRIDSLGS
jgi:cytochrome c-type biogenesis protein CcmH